MIIKKMTATFGCLSGAEMRFEPGFNLIAAANESGKSTWCAFIRDMLYGVDSSERAKGGSLPDKQRYAPWSGAPMEGTMDIVYRGRDVTLCRRTRLASAPMRDFSACYTGTGESVPGMTGANAGELITGGISAEVLRRSAFIGQGDVAVSGAAELEKRIASVVSSGEEGTSYTEADARLRAWQRRRQYNHRGAIPEEEAEIENQSRRLETLSGALEERDRVSGELERVVLAKQEAEAEAESARTEFETSTRARLSAARLRETDCENAFFAAMQESAVKKSQADRGVFAGMAPGEAFAAVDSDAERLETLRAGEKKPRYWLTLILALAAIACGPLGYFYSWYLYLAGIALFIAATASFIANSVKSGRAAKCQAERLEILGKYSAADGNGIIAAAEEHARRYDEYSSARDAEDQARAAMDQARAEREKAESDLLAGPDARAAELSSRISGLDGDFVRLSSRLSELSGRAQALGDPAAIQADIAQRRERRDELAGQYDAIALAAAALGDADAEMQTRFSPALGQAAARYMSQLTGGRYSELTLSRDFSAMTRLAGDAAPHEAAYMSCGANDMLYLAVRLAVCDMALPEEDPCPIILDEVLANFDPQREARVVELLKKLGEKRQVILFTCK